MLLLCMASPRLATGTLGVWRFCADITAMNQTLPAARADRLTRVLTAVFAPTLLRVTDDSAQHAGHAGAASGGQTHYSVLIVSDRFAGMTRVARSRAVHEALAAEFAAGMHALALRLRTPEEHARAGE
jgi:BolA family transcriptional regulator, general stress-responsive regulator